MFDRISSQITCSRNIFTIFLQAPEKAFEVSAQELGAEIDEAELASELFSQTQVEASNQGSPQVSAEDFEIVYNWFLS